MNMLVFCYFTNNTIQHGTVQHNTTQHGTTQYVQYDDFIMIYIIDIHRQYSKYSRQDTIQPIALAASTRRTQCVNSSYQCLFYNKKSSKNIIIYFIHFRVHVERTRTIINHVGRIRSKSQQYSIIWFCCSAFSSSVVPSFTIHVHGTIIFI